jgi:hypothetical protein
MMAMPTKCIDRWRLDPRRDMCIRGQRGFTSWVWPPGHAGAMRPVSAVALGRGAAP